MKELLCILILIFAHHAQASEDCERKVVGHYKAEYHRTYAAASNTFLNNFVGRKNMKAHTLGHPDIAFLGLSFNQNYIAENIVNKSHKSATEVLAKYMELLKTGELCYALGDDYKSFKQVRSLLLEKLKED